MLKKWDEFLPRITLEKPDIICITEIKPKNGQLPDKKLLEIKGYDLFLNNAYHHPTTRGVYIYTKEILKATPVITHTTNIFDDSVWASIPGPQGRNLLIGCIYRSGSPEKAIPLDDGLHKMITAMAHNKDYKEVMIVGDFNHPNITWSPAPHITTDHAAGHPDLLFVDCIHDSYLHQHVNEPTRYRDEQHPTIDDLIFTTNQLLIDDITYSSHLGKSDHISLNFNVDFCLEPSTENNKQKYNYYKTDLNKMRTMLDLDWETLLAGKHTEEAYQVFIDKYEQAKQECVPMSKKKQQ